MIALWSLALNSWSPQPDYECGRPCFAARGMMAEETIVRFEGSLVVARVLGDNSAFERVLKLLPELLTVP
jgi:hypothetical protein